MGWDVIAQIAMAVIAATGLGLSASGALSPATPDLTALAPRQPSPPGVPQLPPSAAPDRAIETEDQKARQRAAMRIRDLASRQSAPSTVLSAPLGISTPSSSSTLLGR